MTPIKDFKLPIEANQIQDFLPQRFPMLLLDRVIAHDPNHRLTAIKNVTFNEPFFQGHFPQHPIMPGVLIIEAMAQAAGILGFITEGKRPVDGYMYLFAGADKVRFKRKVVPGDRLVITAEHITSKRGIFKFFCTASVDDELAASVEITVAEQQMDTL